MDKWKAVAGWLYLIIVCFDFLLAPYGNMALSAYYHFNYVPWVPLTLQGAGIFHIAFGAIMGVQSWTQGLAQVEMIKNQPDYSSMPYVGNGMMNDFQTPYSTGTTTIQNSDSVLNNPKRGIGTGH